MVTLLPFAKVSDLQLLAPGTTDDQAELLLDLVSASIRETVHWHVDQVTGLTFTKSVRPLTDFGWNPESGLLVGSRPLTFLTLPCLNLTVVTTLVVDGVTLVAAGVPISSTVITTDQAAGVIYFNDRPVNDTATVTYTAGYVRAPQDQVPAIFRTVALDYAARWSNNPSSVSSYTMGSTSESFATPDLVAALDADHRLDAYRVDQ